MKSMLVLFATLVAASIICTVNAQQSCSSIDYGECGREASQIMQCESASYLVCELPCVTSTLSRCVEASPAFENFQMMNVELANTVRDAVECCFDSNNNHTMRRTGACSRPRSKAGSLNMSILILVPFILLTGMIMS